MGGAKECGVGGVRDRERAVEGWQGLVCALFEGSRSLYSAGACSFR